MKLKITIESENAAFTDNAETETARILGVIANKIEMHGDTGGSCIDANGNKVGQWSFKP